MKFETVRIHFLSGVLICCHPEIWYHGNVTERLFLSYSQQTHTNVNMVKAAALKKGNPEGKS